MFKLSNRKERVNADGGAILTGCYEASKSTETSRSRTFNVLFEKTTGQTLNFRKRGFSSLAKLENNEVIELFNKIDPIEASVIADGFNNKLQSEDEEHVLRECITSACALLEDKPEPTPQPAQPNGGGFDFNQPAQPAEPEQEPKQDKQNKEQDMSNNQGTKAEVNKVESNGDLKGMFNFNFPMEEFLTAAVKQEVPEIGRALSGELKEQIQEAAKELQPNVISVNNKELGTVTGKMHRKFETAFKILTATQRLYLKGDTGTGKSFLARQLAEGLKLSFKYLPLTAGITEGKITGMMLVNGDFVKTDFLDIYENGGVMLFDEVDAADSNTLLTINNAIEEGSMPVPARRDNPQAIKHKDFHLVCAANTWGTGNEGDFHGREYQDKSFLNRFSASKLNVDYDKDLEEELLKDHAELRENLQRMRDNSRSKGLERAISTRTLRDAAKLMNIGFTIKEAIDVITTDYTEEEKTKILKGVNM